MLVVSLALNLAVLVPVCASLLLGASWTLSAYGPPTPARGILLSIYLAIGAASSLLLVRPDPEMVTALLGVQVIYKLTTPFTVGTWRNPVVLSNLAIAAVHTATLTMLTGH
jgi:hypothetical protein